MLVQNASIIDAHHGYLADRSAERQVYVLPTNFLTMKDTILSFIQASATLTLEERNNPPTQALEQTLVGKI